MDLKFYDWFLEHLPNVREGQTIAISIEILRERLDYNKPPDFFRMLKELREGYNSVRPKDFSQALNEFIDMVNSKYNMKHYIDQTVNGLIFKKQTELKSIGLIDKKGNLYGPIDAFFEDETFLTIKE